MNDFLNFNNVSSQENHSLTKLDAKQIKSDLLLKIKEVLFYLFPKGYVKNNCFYIGSTKGEAGKSLKVELNGERQGDWYDFATNQGGDIFSLWEEVRGYHKSDFSKVLAEINSWLGNPSSIYSKQIVRSHNFIDNLGKPTAKWNYLDKAGRLIACVYRYDTEAGKEFRVLDVKK